MILLKCTVTLCITLCITLHILPNWENEVSWNYFLVAFYYGGLEDHCESYDRSQLTLNQCKLLAGKSRCRPNTNTFLRVCVFRQRRPLPASCMKNVILHGISYWLLTALANPRSLDLYLSLTYDLMFFAAQILLKNIYVGEVEPTWQRE